MTGGRSGIGEAIAERLRQEGAWVFTAQRREDEQCEHVLADFADPHSAIEVIGHVMAQAERLDVLVNNAGVMQESTVAEMSIEAWIET